MTLRIPPEIIDGIVAHALAEKPRECCGLVAGLDGIATRGIPIANSEAGNRMYVMNADEQFRAEREIDGAGESVLAIYHSHPVTESYPSRTDIEYAYWPESDDLIWPDAIHIICSLADEERPVVRAFRLSKQGIDEVPLG